MILYRLSGRIAADGFSPQWIVPEVGPNLTEVRKAATKLVKECKAKNRKHDLRLQKLTIHPPNQALVINLLISEDVSTVIEGIELLEHWSLQEN